MKTLSKHTLASAIAIPLVAVALLVGAVIVKADSAPSISTSIHASGHNTVTSVAIGTSVHSSVVMASSSNATSTPAGTVNFTVYPNTSCSGTGTTESGVVLVNGVAESSATTTTANGLSYLVHYNGQTDIYSSINSGCQSLNVMSSNAGISTTLSANNVMTGASVYTSASLSNVTSNASGTVAYTIYSDSPCSTFVANAGTFNVTNGVVPNSSTLQFNNAGTFYWRAVYSGDANNSGVTSACVPFTVGTTSIPATTTPGTAMVSGIVYNDLNRNLVRDAGEPGLSGWIIKLFNKPNYKGTSMTASTDANGYYSFSNLAAGIYTVEEMNHESDGYGQETKDYTSLVIGSGASVQNINFANATGTIKNHNGNNGHDKNDDNGHDKDKGNKGNNGNHYGWYKQGAEKLLKHLNK